MPKFAWRSCKSEFGLAKIHFQAKNCPEFEVNDFENSSLQFPKVGNTTPYYVAQKKVRMSANSNTMNFH